MAVEQDDQNIMGTPFIQFLGPSNLDGYNRTKASSEQPDSIPKTFLDAMEVREEVFVREQKVPLQNEFDSDDARAYHWVRTVQTFPTFNNILIMAGHLCLG